jgi:putative peptidoglycan lipid II flippase
MMSRHAAEKNLEALKHTLAFSLRIVSFITVPAMVGLILLRTPIVEVLFEHGKFNAQSTQLTAWALWFYAIGLPWFAFSKILVPAFYSTQDTRTPVKVAFGVMFANIVMNMMFLRPLLNGGPALATSLAGVINSVLLYKIFVDRHGDIGGRAIAQSLGRICLASLGMGAITWAMQHFVGMAGHHRLPWRALMLGLVLAVSTGSYFLLAWLLHCEELSDIYGIARRRRDPSAPVEVG